MAITIGSKTRSVTIKQYESIILNILRNKPDARDNDYALYYYILKERRIDPTTMTAYDMLIRSHKGQIPSIFSVTRARRKVQEKYPETRGELWDKRHSQADNIREEMSE
jgi:hypothetical protein